MEPSSLSYSLIIFIPHPLSYDCRSVISHTTNGWRNGRNKEVIRLHSPIGKVWHHQRGVVYNQAKSELYYPFKFMHTGSPPSHIRGEADLCISPIKM